MLGTPKNYIFMEETGGTNKWENIPYSKIGRIFSDKMSILPKAFYKFSAIPIKIPNGIFHRNRTNKPKTCMEPQNIPKIQSNPEWEQQSRGIILPHVQLYCKAIVIRTVWCWHKNRHTDPWNKTDNPKINPCIYGQLIIKKDTRIYGKE